ncbi:DUF1616 domain-containing protein [Haladaptatus salinisoli]|uniref:DUF1616 domain-containing protein n=1 Tax=Haladaptatus salinisoli TaxID=2884876 RepID=UPI001D0B0690|nr:DUF1616 domain-containing protein [Haladaptatus salinisoli]
MSHGTTESWLSRITRPVFELPADLVGVVVAVAAVAFTLAQSGVRGTPVAVALGLPFVLFAPGYALVSLLFPGTGPSRRSGWTSPARVRREGITPGERAALSFGGSLALVPVLALSLSLASVPFEPLPVLVAVFGLTLTLSVFAALRRGNVPAEDRFGVSFRTGASRLRAALFGAESSADVALNVVLALSVVVALSAVGFAFAAPQDGERFSRLSLLEREGGKFVTAKNPEPFEVGETKPVHVAVDNREGKSVEYTVVVQLQRVEQRPDGSARVVDRVELDRLSHRVAAGESWRTRYAISPTMAGENLRLQFLLYKGDPPANPTTSNADEHAHLWIDVAT